MSSVALLDVNVLVALFDPGHVHHDLAHDWFADNRGDGWATSPTTEASFLRVLSNPAYGVPALRLAELIELLRKFRVSGHHTFWEERISLLDESVFDSTMLNGHRQITDAYLLGLATVHGGRLATFDRAMPLKAVRAATRANLVEIVAIDDHP